MVGSYDKAKLKDLKLEGGKGGGYFLNATYEYENKYGVYELNIPHIQLPIYAINRLPDWGMVLSNYPHESGLRIDMGYGEVEVLKDHKTGMTHTIKEIKKKTQKMTLSEIEAKLGHKIELISEK